MHKLFTQQPWFVYTLLGFFSVAVGSFLNAVIYRLPLMMQKEWTEYCSTLLQIKTEQKATAINLLLPRSFCPHCKTKIRAWNNIPLLSYLFLKGRCADCHQPISIRYPLIELLTLVLSLSACWHFGGTVKLLFALIAIYLLIVLTFIDLDHQIVPDSLSLSLLWLGLLANTQNLFTTLPEAVVSSVLAYLSLWLFVQIYYFFTGKLGMGNGDFKLFAALGAWFGWMHLPLILFLASLTGALAGSIYLKLARKPKDTTLAFGPFLCAAGLVCLFWGDPISAFFSLLFASA